MQKDVIYIDVEDDITAIIGKLKASKSKIVALVPPKRIGAIQSAVNLKLVHRAAEQADKRLVIVSNNQALMALAGSAGIPVAKNLQSKPELAEVAALDVDDGEDIIDGSELPVGEHAAQVADTKKPSTLEKDAAAAAAGLAAAGVAATADAEETSVKAVTPKVAAGALGAKAAKNLKVPNFNTMRKKLFLIGGGLLALIIFLIWAIFFAPTAKIIITAKTSDSALNSNVTLGQTLATDLKAGTVKSETKTVKKDTSVPFTATGKKEVGEKATGAVKFSTRNIDNLGTTIPAGTVLTASGGSTYTTDSSVTITMQNYKSATTGITASDRGTKYNSAQGAVSGAPAGISANIDSPTTGGTDKTITIVQQSDIDAVADQISKPDQEEAAKSELKTQFKDDYIILESTFKADKGAVAASPAVGQESSDGKGTLSGSVTYSLTAVPKSEAGKYLDAYFKQQIDGKLNQKVYQNGLKNVNFTNINATDSGFTANISTNGKIGPIIDDAKTKQFAKGKSFGEIQAEVQSIDGVENADIKFAPFWVTRAPNDVNHITVEFKVNE